MACLTWEAGPPPWPGSASVLQAALHIKFPVIFPVMCSLILDQRPLDSRVMGSQIKFSLFYYLLLYLTSALEVGTIPTFLVRKIITEYGVEFSTESALPTHFFPLHPASLSVLLSHLCLSQRGPLWPLKLKKNFSCSFPNSTSYLFPMLATFLDIYNYFTYFLASLFIAFIL